MCRFPLLGNKDSGVMEWGTGVGQRPFLLCLIIHFDFCIRFAYYLMKIRN